MTTKEFKLRINKQTSNVLLFKKRKYFKKKKENLTSNQHQKKSIKIIQWKQTFTYFNVIGNDKNVNRFRQIQRRDIGES